MSYLDFRNQFYTLGCFNIHQVNAWQPNFDKNSISRWSKKNLLVKLRNGYYSFPEYLSQSGFAFYISNRIYRPSYISLHSALAFYGMIPEAVVQITAVTSLKTAVFKNAFGMYSYKSIQPNLLFGYEMKSFPDDRSLLFAQPEKALLDLLYLYPFYNTPQEFEDLRMDGDYMQEDLNLERLNAYTERFQSKVLDRRIKLLLKTYGL